MLSFRLCGKHWKKTFVFLGFFFTLLYAAELALSRWKLSKRWSKTAHATIGLRSRQRSNPRPTRFVSGKAGECRDDGLENMRLIRGLGGKFPTVSYALLSQTSKKAFFSIGEGSRNFVSCFLHSSAQMCLYHAPGRRPPPITGRFGNTVTRGWVGAPNERAPFRFLGAVVGFVDRCLSRTRNLAASR